MTVISLEAGMARPAPVQWLLWLALAAIAATPWFAGPFVQHLAVLTCLNVLIVNGLALIARCGQLSLGHAAFVAVGAYGSVLAARHLGWSFVPSTLAGVALTAVIALVLGAIILRLKGVYFVLVTFAFGELVRLVLLDGSSWSGGANGVTGIQPAALAGVTFDTRASFYGLALCVALGSVALLAAVARRPFGHAIDAVAENPALAESTGLSVRRIQLCAFVGGCALAAAGGALQARYVGYVSPESFNASISIGFIIMLVIGGRRSVWGGLIGAMVLTPLPELFRGAVQTQHIFYGAALILILRFLPAGLAGLLGPWQARRGKEPQ
ncbi:branched-chain amino acid ABC transporter permease [Achromobacter sp. MFA1 R4]|uniref:branched-chain amino acid ABC transporter permease n=1 Tax=Achromobacter sp. MFA1 R4 TaxID=1881016 RepID=UPI0009539414|nr:branched-chain amino acid ABC transporter permease [Achromobacter sp. MFA1 R4]SIT26022.1 amino acid/amide ABC transporter membrane protein 2, HAAT family [Achromobacter sp. MFA1 R4]